MRMTWTWPACASTSEAGSSALACRRRCQPTGSACSWPGCWRRPGLVAALRAYPLSLATARTHMTAPAALQAGFRQGPEGCHVAQVVAPPPALAACTAALPLVSLAVGECCPSMLKAGPHMFNPLLACSPPFPLFTFFTGCSDNLDDYIVHDPLLEAGKAKFNKQQAKHKKRQTEWGMAGRGQG